MNVSIAMTTYNGDKYLAMQLDSIIPQLENNDEIIICDDGSADNTLDIIRGYINHDNRIKLFENTRKGAVRNFEDAISKCGNDLIFLCDQDDIWNKNKIETVKEAFRESNASLILHNATNFRDGNVGRNESLIPIMKHGLIPNLLNSCYWGCCMVFRKELLAYCLPFPDKLIAHDQWIGLIAESKKTSKFITQSLIQHRIHDNNVTHIQSLPNMFKFRYSMARCYYINKYNEKNR